MKIGIIGCGSIATIITKFAQKGKVNVDPKFFYDVSEEKSIKLAEVINGEAVKTPKELIEKSDLIVETASQQAAKKIIPQVLESGKDAIILSSGALLDIEFLKKIKKISKENNSQFYIPTGAISGIDAVKAASMGEISEITLTTTKPPHSLGVEVKNNNPKILFEGNASKAVQEFPMNVNVAAVLSLASEKNVKVRIVADPNIQYNTHEIHVKGDFGEINTKIQNKSCSNNPKTSALAAYSTAQLLNRINDNFKIGT
ncbi:MAG: aspartate dehydrogenase [Methanobacteriaceae archaeon]|nr:aspartate dehydrogenase [Methanobacteriaceae archaeon]